MHGLRERWLQRRRQVELLLRDATNLRRESESITGTLLPVGAETGGEVRPCVVGGLGWGQPRTLPFAKIVGVQAVAEVLLLVLAAVASLSHGLALGAGAGTDQGSLRILCALGDHIDDAIDRVCSPQGASRPADNLDPFNVFQDQVLHVPIDA